VSDNAVGKVSAGVQQRESGFDRGSIRDNVCAVYQAANCFSDVAWPDFVALQYPDQFAKRRYRQRNQIRFAEGRLSSFALLGVIPTLVSAVIFIACQPILGQ
jgi:hypothetical protein